MDNKKITKEDIEEAFNFLEKENIKVPIMGGSKCYMVDEATFLLLEDNEYNDKICNYAWLAAKGLNEGLVDPDQFLEANSKRLSPKFKLGVIDVIKKVHFSRKDSTK